MRANRKISWDTRSELALGRGHSGTIERVRNGQCRAVRYMHIYNLSITKFMYIGIMVQRHLELPTISGHLVRRKRVLEKIVQVSLVLCQRPRRITSNVL